VIPKADHCPRGSGTLRVQVGVKTISKWLKQMVQDIPNCDVKSITNKSSRVTAVRHLNAMGVPPNIGMKFIGHTSTEIYALQHR